MLEKQEDETILLRYDSRKLKITDKNEIINLLKYL